MLLKRKWKTYFHLSFFRVVVAAEIYEFLGHFSFNSCSSCLPFPVRLSQDVAITRQDCDWNYVCYVNVIWSPACHEFIVVPNHSHNTCVINFAKDFTSFLSPNPPNPPRPNLQTLFCGFYCCSGNNFTILQQMTNVGKMEKKYLYLYWKKNCW